MYGKLLSGFAALLCASTAYCQVGGLNLPPGESLPTQWTAAPVIQPQPARWSASIDTAITTPAAGVRTYWYRITHTGGGPASPPVQAIKIIALEMDPTTVIVDSAKYQFGIYQAGLTASLNPEPVFEDDIVLNWSYFPTLTGIEPGQTVYLWIRSKNGPSESTVYIQNGSLASTTVPVPGQSAIVSYKANNRALTHTAADIAKAASDFATWGRVLTVSADSITIDDGSGVLPLIMAPGHSLNVGDYIIAGGKLTATSPRPEIASSTFGIVKLD